MNELSTDLSRLDRSLEQRTETSPASSYLLRLSEGSRRTMAQALNYIAAEVSQGRHDAYTFPWFKLRYEHTNTIRALLDKNYSATSANKMLSALRGVLKECWRLGQIQVEELHKACDIQPLKGGGEAKGRALSDDEVHTIATHTTSTRDWSLVLFMAATGLRRAEAVALRWIDIGTDPRPYLIVDGKGGKVREVPVPHHAWVLIENLHARALVAVKAEARVFQYTAGRVWQIIREASFRAGIGIVSPHDLRRTYATNLLKNGVDLSTVQRLMGHASPVTTAKYDKRRLIDDAAAVEKALGRP